VFSYPQYGDVWENEPVPHPFLLVFDKRVATMTNGLSKFALFPYRSTACEKFGIKASLSHPVHEG